MTAVVGIAGRVLWLYESLEPDAAASALELMNHLRPPARRSIYNYFIAELLRPFIGLEPTRALLRRQPPTHDAAARILYLRTRLPVLALDRDHDALGRAIADARRVAHDACAPALGWIADWAAGAQATADSPADALARARAATRALADHGEHYIAARLLLDSALLIGGGSWGGQLGEEAAERFDAMGALASAAQARGAVHLTLTPGPQ